METEATPIFHRDALILAVALLLIGAMWLIWSLFWQGALLVFLAAVVAWSRSRLRAGAGRDSRIAGAKREADDAEDAAGKGKDPEARDARDGVNSAGRSSRGRGGGKGRRRKRRR